MALITTAPQPGRTLQQTPAQCNSFSWRHPPKTTTAVGSPTQSKTFAFTQIKCSVTSGVILILKKKEKEKNKKPHFENYLKKEKCYNSACRPLWQSICSLVCALFHSFSSPSVIWNATTYVSDLLQNYSSHSTEIRMQETDVRQGPIAVAGNTTLQPELLFDS